jgi:nucleotide-binding universal stress UspA family protein
MFKDILLPVLLGDLDESATQQACMLAGRMGATVVALVAASYFVPATADCVYQRAGTYPDMASAGAAILGRYVSEVRKRLATEPISHEVRGVAEFWWTPSEIVVRHALASDVIVLGVGRPIEDPSQKLFAGALMGSGRPVLAVPAAVQAREFHHVLVAWKNSREAARALHDSLPILQQARTVEILLAGQDKLDSTPANYRADSLVEHLQRHGVTARIVRLPRTPMATGWAIVDYAVTSGAGLIVAGGYSHARAMEHVFGGVTLYLLKFSPVPVLFSH